MSDQELARYVGMRLRVLRRDRKLTQEQVIMALDAPGLKLWQYEKGDSLPSLKTLFSLASYFQVSFDALLPHPEAAVPEVKDSETSFNPLSSIGLDKRKTLCFYSHGQIAVNQPAPNLAVIRAALAVTGDYVERAIASGITIFLCNTTNFGLLAAHKVIQAKKKNPSLKCAILDPYPITPNGPLESLPSWEELRSQADVFFCLSHRRTKEQLHQYYDFLTENAGRMIGIYTPLQGERSLLLQKAKEKNIPCGNLYSQFAERLSYEQNILRYERRVEREQLAKEMEKRHTIRNTKYR